MYTTFDYATKKALKADVAEMLRLSKTGENPARLLDLELKLEVYQPNSDMTGVQAPKSSHEVIEGPHYPKPHRWYAAVEIENGIVVKVS